MGRLRGVVCLVCLLGYICFGGLETFSNFLVLLLVLHYQLPPVLIRKTENFMANQSDEQTSEMVVKEMPKIIKLKKTGFPLVPSPALPHSGVARTRSAHQPLRCQT